MSTISILRFPLLTASSLESRGGGQNVCVQIKDTTARCFGRHYGNAALYQRLTTVFIQIVNDQNRYGMIVGKSVMAENGGVWSSGSPVWIKTADWTSFLNEPEHDTKLL
jgi:hypothetical protein